MDREALSKSLAAVPSAKVKDVDYPARGFHLDVSVAPEHLREAVSVLDRAGFFIETVTGVDWLGEKAARRKEAEAAAAAKAKAAAKAAAEAGEETAGPAAAPEPAPSVAAEAGESQVDDLEAVYDFNRYEQLFRVAVRVRVPRDAPSIPTISDIYPGANWHERETRDFFGFDFEGHPYLVPLLLPEDADFHPLRKDYKA